MADELFWIYGVTAAPAPTGMRGVDDRRVEPIEQDGLSALASRVPADAFSGAALVRRLDDLETIERMARAHEAVLDRTLAAGDVIPLRMCTLYGTADTVRGMLRSERERLLAALKRIEGAVELGVKAFALPPRPDAGARPASGVEYLALRLTQRKQAADSEASVERSAAQLHARLADHADGAVLLRPQDRRLSGRDARMVLNGAYLVPRAAAADFQQLLEADDSGQLELELTGPWPPYHFAEVGA
jgi:hypothetical protein